LDYILHDRPSSYPDPECRKNTFQNQGVNESETAILGVEGQSFEHQKIKHPAARVLQAEVPEDKLSAVRLLCKTERIFFSK
jgi:hypothetical protein